MNTQELLHVLNSVNRKLKCKYSVGVFAANEIPKQKFKVGAFIVNTDQNHSPGSHWIAFFFRNYDHCEYFDSYGLAPMITDHLKFISKFKNRKQNKQELQSITSEVCGHYCLLFLIARMKNRSLNDFLSLFTRNRKVNDELVVKYLEGVKKLYQISKNNTTNIHCRKQRCCSKV